VGEEDRIALGWRLGRRGGATPEGQYCEEPEQSKVSSRTGARIFPQSPGTAL